MNNTTSRLPRILTKTARKAHILKACEPHHDAAFRTLVGDIATVHSNMMHNPKTGFEEFAKGTPKWIRDIAASRKWISTLGRMEWK